MNVAIMADGINTEEFLIALESLLKFFGTLRDSIGDESSAHPRAFQCSSRRLLPISPRATSSRTSESVRKKERAFATHLT